MAEIVICEFMDDEAVRDLARSHDTLYDATLVDKPDALKAALADARAIIVRNRTQVRADLLTAAPKLEVVGRLGVGLDNIDLALCEARGVAVFPATGANDLSVAEYVMTAALMLLRRALFASGAVIAGQWPRNSCMGGEVEGKRLGLVGFGPTARVTAEKAKALGMEVAACRRGMDPSDPAWREAGVTPLALADLLATSDVVSLHVPLAADTRRLIDAPALASMKRGAFLINAARGGVVDEAALVAALTSGALGGAALDVFEQEPLSAERGALFAGCPNLILTPHIAGVTDESNIRVSAVTVENVRRRLGPSRA